MREGLFYSREFEAAVIGICMLEATAYGRTKGLIEAKHFYYEDNKTIFKCLDDMFDKNIPIDQLTVWHRLIEQGADMFCMKNVKNPSASLFHYLTGLTISVCNSFHLEFHCDVIKRMWCKREMERLTNQGFDPTEDVKKQAYYLNDQINNLLAGEQKKDWYTMDELMYDLMIHQRDIRDGNFQFVSTGFRTIDRENGGFTPGQLIIVGARPAIGKSALMGKMAMDMAEKGKKVGIVSLEMNNNEVAARLASIDTDIEFSKIYRNLFVDEKESERFYNIISKQTIHLPIFVSDKTKVDVNEIKAKAAKLRYQHGLDILMVDYLQLVDSTDDKKNYNREQEVARISRGLKLMAMDMGIPVMVLCQLNREATKGSAKDRYPKLQNLRESGSLEQDADVVLMLHRDYKSGYEVDPVTGNSTEFEADLLGLKWRNGATFHLKLDFDPPKMKFKEQPNLIPYNPPKEEIEEDEPF